MRATHLEQGVERSHHPGPGDDARGVRSRRRDCRRGAPSLGIAGWKRRGFAGGTTKFSRQRREERERRATATVPPDTKHCPSCAATLPLLSFDRDRSTPSGRAGHCKLCRRRAALVKKGLATKGAEPVTGAVPPRIYGPRGCNLCDRIYVGRGRALCDSCLEDVNGIAPMAVGVSA